MAKEHPWKSYGFVSNGNQTTEEVRIAEEIARMTARAHSITSRTSQRPPTLEDIRKYGFSPQNSKPSRDTLSCQLAIAVSQGYVVVRTGDVGGDSLKPTYHIVGDLEGNQFDNYPNPFVGSRIQRISSQKRRITEVILTKIALGTADKRRHPRYSTTPKP